MYALDVSVHLVSHLVFSTHTTSHANKSLPSHQRSCPMTLSVEHGCWAARFWCVNTIQPANLEYLTRGFCRKMSTVSTDSTPPRLAWRPSRPRLGVRGHPQPCTLGAMQHTVRIEFPPLAATACMPDGSLPSSFHCEIPKYSSSRASRVYHYNITPFQLEPQGRGRSCSGITDKVGPSGKHTCVLRQRGCRCLYCIAHLSHRFFCVCTVTKYPLACLILHSSANGLGRLDFDSKFLLHFSVDCCLYIYRDVEPDNNEVP